MLWALALMAQKGPGSYPCGIEGHSPRLYGLEDLDPDTLSPNDSVD